MADHDIIAIAGEEFGTGLHVPAVRETSCPLFADSGDMLTADQIKSIIADPNRQSGRKRFGDDWIGNQGSLGACNGFSTAYGVARARVRRGLPRVMLSGFGLYSAINGGRDNGSSLERGFKWIQENGVPPITADEKATYLWSQVPAEAKAKMGEYKAIECFGISTELELACALARGYDCIVAVHANNRWSQLDSDGVCGESNGLGNHSVLCDDVTLSSSGGFLFDMANSWSTRFGHRGRGFLAWRRHFLESIKHHYFFAIRSTVDSSGDNPVL